MDDGWMDGLMVGWMMVEWMVVGWMIRLPPFGLLINGEGWIGWIGWNGWIRLPTLGLMTNGEGWIGWIGWKGWRLASQCIAMVPRWFDGWMDDSTAAVWSPDQRRRSALGIIFNDPSVRRSYPKPFRLRRLNICLPALVSKLPMQSITNMLHLVQRLCNFALGIDSPAMQGQKPDPDRRLAESGERQKKITTGYLNLNARDVRRNLNPHIYITFAHGYNKIWQPGCFRQIIRGFNLR